MLYRRWFDEKTGHEGLQLCVPPQLKDDVLQELHDQCRHLSVRKTTDGLRKRLYWVGHSADIELYCRPCNTCGSRNGPIPRTRAPMQSIKAGYPLERIQIDILDPLPETDRGNKFVAVVVDMYTKWPEAYVLPDQEAGTVAQAVMDNFVFRVSDIPRLMQLMRPSNRGQRHTILSVVGEQNGLSTRLPVLFPRFQGSRKSGISIFLISSWLCEHPPRETTGFSLIMLMFGRELRFPIDAMNGRPPSERPSNYPSFFKKQHEILRRVYQRVGENLRVNLRHQKDVYDARCKGNSRPSREGDLVWLEDKAVPRWVHRKFFHPWSGPWRVVKVISDVTYRIQCEEVAPTRIRRKTRMIGHFNRLKPYLPRSA